MSRSATVHWMLEELGVPYEVELVDLKKKQQKSPELLALNPMGKLPTLVHDDVVVTESAAICAYLADAFPEKKLAPAINDSQRGPYLRWLFFTASCFEPALLDNMMKRTVTDPSALGYGSFEDTMKTLESQLQKGPFIIGDTFTAADVYLASQLSWAMMVKALEPRPVFSQYVQRCSERPAFARFRAQAKDQIAKMQS